MMPQQPLPAEPATQTPQRDNAGTEIAAEAVPDTPASLAPEGRLVAVCILPIQPLQLPSAVKIMTNTCASLQLALLAAVPGTCLKSMEAC